MYRKVRKSGEGGFTKSLEKHPDLFLALSRDEGVLHSSDRGCILKGVGCISQRGKLVKELVNQHSKLIGPAVHSFITNSDEVSTAAGPLFQL
jgi:hypothetical protein